MRRRAGAGPGQQRMRWWWTFFFFLNPSNSLGWDTRRVRCWRTIGSYLTIHGLPIVGGFLSLALTAGPMRLSRWLLKKKTFSCHFLSLPATPTWKKKNKSFEQKIEMELLYRYAMVVVVVVAAGELRRHSSPANADRLSTLFFQEKRTNTILIPPHHHVYRPSNKVPRKTR